MKGNKCECGPANFLWLIIAVIVMGIGIWFVIGGVNAQWNGAAEWQMILVWYSLGLLILSIGKMFKRKSCCMACGGH